MTNEANHKTHRSDLAFVQEMMKIPILEREKELELATAWREHRDEKALHQLIRAYARLVISMALRFRHYGLPLNDLIQEGNLGLMQAAERFEPEREFRFSTYAKWWIRSFIQDFILRNWSIVRTGSTLAQKQLFFNLRRLRAELKKMDVGVLSENDRQTIADKLHVTLKDVESMENRLAAHDLSLSTPTGEDSEDHWLDLLTDERGTPEDVTFQRHNSLALHDWIQTAMQNLTPRERQIIFSRRLSDTPATLDDLGKSLKISKERVRQLEARAIRKMRYHLMRNIHDAKDLLVD